VHYVLPHDLKRLPMKPLNLLTVSIIVLSLNPTACRPAASQNKSQVATIAQACHQQLQKNHPTQRDTLKIATPQPLQDGTLIIQWQLDNQTYGSCRVDSTGHLIQLTQN
jgi:hypothetical protein